MSGNTKSCGCARNKRLQKSAQFYKESYSVRTHPLNALYNRWSTMWDRCTRPSHKAFHRYGGRGITVCDAWKSFEQFYADVGLPPFKGASLDRKDNDKGYSPDNVRWATAKQQRANQQRPPHKKTLPQKATLPDDWLEGTLLIF